MKCSNCGNENNIGSKFCIKCGASLEQQNVENVAQSQNNNIQNNQSFNSSVQSQVIGQNNIPVQPQQPVYNQQKSVNSSLNYLTYIAGILLKPFKKFKEEEKKLSDPKIAIIFSSIVAVSMMLITLIKSMISVMFVKTLDYSTFKYKTTFDFGNIKNLDWVGLLLKNLLLYAGIIAVVALVYYIVGLIFKKNTNYIKMLSITATSILPYILIGMIISPILAKIWTPLAIISVIIGAVYSILIFINLVNDSVTFESVDLKIYFHLICLSIIFSAGYYCYIKIVMSQISNQLNNFINLFG